MRDDPNNGCEGDYENSRFWVACVSWRNFNDSVEVIILKLNLKVEELDRVDFGFNDEVDEGMYI